MRDRFAVLVSPYFPPSTLAGVHRARHLAKHLPAAGWQPIVLCVDEACHEERLDPALAALVPSSVEVVKVGAIPFRLTRLGGIGEISLRAWYPLRNALFSLLGSRAIGAVLITGSPYYPMLFAQEIRRRFDVPVVLDFQDPWVSSSGRPPPALAKAGLAYRLATLLEPRALRAADFVTSVSDIQNAEMIGRYPWLSRSRMAGIPIGGDPDDFAALRATERADKSVNFDAGFIHFSYVGTFWPRAEPAMRSLFRAFARLRADEPALASRIRFNFVGTSAQSTDISIPRVQPIAAAEGVAEAVRELPARVPYLSALSVLARSDAVLLIGSDEPHYTASKIYPSLMCGRPFLSLYHRASSSHAILLAAGGGRALAFAELDELAALEQPLADALRALALNPEAFGAANPSAYAAYEARAVAEQFARIFDRVAAGRSGSATC